MAEEEQVQNLSIKERIQNWNQLSKSTSDLSLSNEASNKSTSKETSEIPSPSTTTTTKVDEEVKTNESKPKKEETNLNEQTFEEFSQEHHITKLPGQINFTFLTFFFNKRKQENQKLNRSRKNSFSKRCIPTFKEILC